MKSYPKGSEWRKWDLHVHSPASALNNQFAGKTDKERWTAYLGALAAVKDVSVIGITDYFSVEGYKKVSAAKLTNFDLVVPNVELRMLPVTKADTPINIHVIFNPAIVDDLDSKFFSGLEYEYRGETFKCTRVDLIKLGRKYKNDPLLDEEAAYREGVDQFKIRSIDDIKALFKKDEVLSDNSLVAVSNSNFDGASGIQHSSLASTREEIYRFADFLFSSNPKDRSYFLGEGTDTEPTLVRKYGCLKACIHGSDAHDLFRIGKPCAIRSTHDCAKDPADCEMRYCWVKADPTYEGLKQIAFEPAERVKIQSADPTSLKSNYCIETIEIFESSIDDEFAFKHTVLPINANLVAVTGGKGSGKTAFVDLVANCYSDRKNTDDTNSFVRRITTDSDPDLKIKITLKDGTVFEKNISDPTYYEDSPIIYIAQGNLESHVTNTEALEKHIDELIFESPKVKDTEKQFEYESLLAEASGFSAKLQKKNNQIYALEQKTTELVETALTTELGQHKAKLKDVASRLTGIEKSKSKAKTTEAQKKQEELEKLRNRKQQLTGLQKAVQTAVELHADNLPLFNDEIKKINSAISRLKLASKPYPAITYDKIDDLEGLDQTVAKELKAVVASIEKFQKNIQKTAEDFKLHTKLLDDKKTLQKAIIDTQAKVKTLGEDRARLVEEKKKRKDILKELLQKKVALKEAYDVVIAAFSENADEVLNDLSFSADMHFNDDAFHEGCSRLFDERSVTVRASAEKSSDFAALMAVVAELMKKSDSAHIDAYVAEIDKALSTLQSKARKAVTSKMLCDHLYHDFWSVIPSVKYKKVSLGKLSLGQKATVLIKIYLAQGDKPIIIDSHDDHLDNEFIMDELVVAVRNAKTYRQVIIVSNNGNMVINSDAEQLVIASRDDAGSISYVSGSLENAVLRERALTVLEGGKTAFVKRQQKYRLQA
jgi:hypothetical protein